MKKIWWSWDIRMRWAHGLSWYPDSYVRNYKRAIDAARRYGVEAIVIWGFLRDEHGGIDAARAVRDYAGEKGIIVLPGVGIDDYGGVYYQGDSRYALDTYIRQHPESQARNEDGSPATHLWPPTDQQARLKACPSDRRVLAFYRESIEWLVDTFRLDGFQIEQGDSGLCYCERCRAKPRVVELRRATSLSDAAERISAVIQPALCKKPDLFILSETYLGLTRADVQSVSSVLNRYPEQVVLSWQLYDGPSAHAGQPFPARFIIDEDVQSPRPHGNAAIRTNNDAFLGEVDDGANIRRALDLSKRAGLDMTYIYGEYPDDWPITRKNYDVWSSGAG